MRESLSLSELQQVIRDSLYLALPDFYWVVAEITEIKQNYSGHCYLELVEKKQDDSVIKARIKAVIWGSRYGFVKSYFENATGETLHEGLKILIRVRIEYHEIYGLSLIINDIDPSYTVGEMAARRQLIIKRLQQEGIFGMNRELDMPQLPQRIAVISSGKAAGYADFINHLKNNTYRYAFYPKLFEAVMQGTETEQSIINALDKIALKHERYDVVVIIRGGGSQTDLSWFDNYNIAFHITQFPIPVITGIGHEKDLSVTDMVACMSLKTPTAVAGFLIETVAETENHLIEISLRIKDATLRSLVKYKEKLEKYRNTLVPLTRILISDVQKRLTDQMIALIRLGKERIFREDIHLVKLRSTMNSSTINRLRFSADKLTGMESRLRILDPVNVLKRGFTITSHKGKILKSTSRVEQGSVIETTFSDGRISSIVSDKLK